MSLLRTYTVQNVFAFFIGFSVLVFGTLSRFLFPIFFTPDVYGVLVNGLSLILYLSTITDLGVTYTLMRFFGEAFHRRGTCAFPLLFRLLLLRLGVLGLITTICILFADTIAPHIMPGARPWYLQIVGIGVLLYGISVTLGTVFASINQYQYVALNSFLINFSKTFFPLAAVIIVGGLDAVYLSLIPAFLFPALGAAVMYFFFVRKYMSICTQDMTIPPDTLSFLASGALLSFLSYIFGAPEVTILSIFRGPAEAAYYSLAMTIIFSLFAVLPLNFDVMFSSIVELSAKNEEVRSRVLFEKTLKYGLVLTVFSMAAIFAFAPTIFIVLQKIFPYDAAYYAAAQPLRILAPVVVCIFLISICQRVLMAKKDMSYLIKSMAIVFVSAVILQMIFTPTFGAQGTALAVVLSFLISVVLLMTRAIHAMGTHIPIHYFTKPFVLSLPLIVMGVGAEIALFDLHLSILAFLVGTVIFIGGWFLTADGDDQKLIHRALGFLRRTLFSLREKVGRLRRR